MQGYLVAPGKTQAARTVRAAQGGFLIDIDAHLLVIVQAAAEHGATGQLRLAEFA
jgi:hypothetical protein